MSAQVHDYSYSAIGRMFARQNVPSVYGMHKAASAMEPEETGEVVDSVSLSPFAPKPLAANLLQDALAMGKTIGSGEKIGETDMTRLREDRVFAAVSALALMGDDGGESTPPRAWPGGIPAPTPDEMEAARRRLAQRLKSGDADTTEQLQQERVTLLEKIGKREFGRPTQTDALEAAALSSSN